MPCPEAPAVWEFDAAWTGYRLQGPAELSSHIDEIAITTPRSLTSTHQVESANTTQGDSL